MPDDRDAGRPGIERDEAARAADHAGIGRLADGLVPALAAKLTALNVGELEVSEDGWHVRLRRPPDGALRHGRRSTDRAGRAAGHDAHPHGGGGDGHRPVDPGHRSMGRAGAMAAASANGSGADDASDRRGAGIATSPAVGIFRPDGRAVGGTRVKAGDRLGLVDVLGIPQEVTAPVDGVVVEVIAEAGTAVEYGQELVVLEPATTPAGHGERG